MLNEVSFKDILKPSMVAHAFNHSSWEAGTGGFLSSTSAWSTDRVPVQPGLHSKTLSWGCIYIHTHGHTHIYTLYY